MMTLMQTLLAWWRGRPLVGRHASAHTAAVGQWSLSQSQPRVRLQYFDFALLWVVLGLLLWGLVMVYSASIAMPDMPKPEIHHPYHYVLRQSIAAVLGTTVAVLAFRLPTQCWHYLAVPLFIFGLLLLVIVLIPQIGVVAGRARRWLPLGFMNFQPSELMKWCMVVYAAHYMQRKFDMKENFLRAVLPMIMPLAVVGLLLVLQPDLGSFIVVAFVAVVVLFLGGVRLKGVLLTAVVGLAVIGTIIATSKTRRERIFAYLNPWDENNVLDKGYQLTHSLIAVARGEWLGVGLGASVEKLHWLPEVHTDFLFALIAEEFGLIGVAVLLMAFFWLVRRIMAIGRTAIEQDHRVFQGLLAQGVALWIGFQAFIHVGVNMGVLPTKGLTLPFMSSGGSALLVNLLAMGVVLRIDYENRCAQGGGRLQ